MKEKIIPGAVGAVLGGLVGAALWIVLGRMELSPGIAGYVIGVCSIKGYKFGGDSLSKRGIVICVFFSFIMILTAEYISIGMTIYRNFNEYRLLTYGEAMKSVPQFFESGLKGDILKNLVLGCGLAIAGGVSYMKRLGHETKAVEQNQKKIKDIIYTVSPYDGAWIDSYQKITALLTDDPEILNDLSNCFHDPFGYFNRHLEEFEERGIDTFDSNDTAWFSLINRSLDKKVAWEFDVKTDLQEFLWGMKPLAAKKGMLVEESWFPSFDGHCYVERWCRILDERLNGEGFSVGELWTDSDSFVVFISKKSDLQILEQLARKVNQRIVPAKDIM